MKDHYISAQGIALRKLTRNFLSLAKQSLYAIRLSLINVLLNQPINCKCLDVSNLYNSASADNA